MRSIKIFFFAFFCFVSDYLIGQNVAVNTDGSAPRAGTLLDVKADQSGEDSSFVITTAGNVGVGTTSPTGALQIVKSSASSSVYNFWSIAGNSATNEVISLVSQLNSTGSGQQTGFYNSLANAGTGIKNGVYNQFSGGTGDLNGVINSLSASGTSQLTGIYNDLSTTGSGIQIGTFNRLNNAGTGEKRALYNEVINGTGIQFGIYNRVTTSAGASPLYGSFNDLEHDGTGDSYLIYGTFTGSTSTGTEYGLYVMDEEVNYLSGNLGVGTSEPSSLLNLSSNHSKTDRASGAMLKLYHETQDQNAYIMLSQDAAFENSKFLIGSDFDNVQAELWSEMDGPMLFATDDTEQMRIDENGNIGIGTSSPSTLLHVRTGGTPPVISDQTVAVFQRNTVSTNQSMISIIGGNNATKVGLNFGDDDDENVGGIFYAHDVNKMSFRTLASDSRMVIDSTGNVGIGTTNPLRKLHVYGDFALFGVTNTQQAFIGADGSNVAYSGSFTNHPYQLRVNNSTKMHIATDGNIGIGTTSVNEKLTVEGAISLDEIAAPSYTAGYGKIYVKSSDSLLYYKDGGGTEYDLTAGATVAWTTTGSDVYRGGGNVGIGETTPFFTLDMGNNLGRKLALYQNGSGFDFYGLGISAGFLDFYAADNGGSPDMRIKSDGNVGIGVSDPGFLLEVAGVAEVDGLSVNESYRLPQSDGSVDQVLATDGSGVVDWLSVADLTTSCPVGFTAVSAAGRTLGCIQTAEEGSATFYAAIDNCFATYGGRLPSVSEMFAAMNNFVLTDETDDIEWLDQGYTGGSAYVMNTGSLTPVSAVATSSAVAYRCWVEK